MRRTKRPLATRERRHVSARVAAYSRHRGDDDELTKEARRDLLAIFIEEEIRKLLQGDPPPTREQRVWLKRLLDSP